MLLATVSLKATTRTVSNDPNSPAQYHDLQVAINASGPGDTLLIGPSLQYGSGSNWYAQSYGSITLNFNLVLIGAGAFFDDENNITNKREVTKVDYINLKQISSTSGAGGSKLFGMDISYVSFQGGFSGSTATTGGISNVLIERCKISYVDFGGSYNHTNQNDTVRNCIITTYILFSTYSTSSTKRLSKNISIEPRPSSVGAIDFCFDAYNTPRVVFSADKKVKYARRVESVSGQDYWVVETPEDSSSAQGDYVSIAVDSANRAHLIYLDDKQKWFSYWAEPNFFDYRIYPNIQDIQADVIRN